MIEINLVPEHLRKKRRVQSASATAGSSPRTGLPIGVIVGIIGFFTGILIVGLIIFQVFLAVQISKRNNLKSQLAGMEQERNNVEKIIKEMKELKDRLKTLEKVIGTSTVLWAEKLNDVSDNLPRGVWLTKVGLEGNFFVVEGSAVSKMKTEIADVHALTGKLKSSKSFMASLKNLDLDMIKARTVGTLSVADFKIKAELVTKPEPAK